MMRISALAALLFTVSVMAAVTVPAPYCTYSQGGYGSNCPNQQPTTQPGCIRDACFATAFPSGIKIGTRTWSTSAQVAAFLPAGGADVLTGQVLALTLSLGFDSTAARANTVCRSLVTGTNSQNGGLANVIFTGSGPLNGVSIGAIRSAAVAMLNAGQTLWSVNSKPVTRAQFNTAITAINEGTIAGIQFHECHMPGDLIPPVITVPTLPCTEATSAAGAAVSFTVTAQDNVDGSVAVSCTPASGSNFAIGSTSVTCTATDSSQNTATKTFTVSVCDKTPPTVTPVTGTVPPTGFCYEATTAQGAQVTYTKPTSTDAVGGVLGVSCDKVSGSWFPVGSNTVTCTATDSAGNTGTFTFTIEVCDTIAPVLAQPPNVPCTEATGPAGAVVTYTKPAATDAADANVVVTCAPASGSTFAVGTTTVTCNAVDQAGNPAAPVTFTVAVCDTSAPSICNEPDNIPCVEATSHLGAIVHYIPPTANDLVDVTDPVVCVLPSGSFFPIGLNHVVCTSTDAAGNKASLTFTVLVCDSIAPVITQPPNVPCVEATSHTGAVVTYNTPAATDAGDANVVVTCSPASGTVFAVGTHNVVCTAADASGNRAQSVTFSVQVCDHTPPVITNTPANIPCVEATSPSGAVVTYTNPSATDIVDTSVVVICVKASGSTFAVGVNTVICTARDSHGNAATSSFTIEVCDRTPPVITNTPSNIPCQEATSPAGAMVSYIHPTASDIVDGAVVVSCVLPAGSTFPIGTSVVVCTATDAHGNSADTSFTVDVCDRTPPTIHNTPSNIPCVEATSPAGAVVTYQLPSADDVVDGVVSVTCVLASGSTFPIGPSTVICSSTDAHDNTATTSFTVLVCDRTPPVITQPPNIPCVEATSSLGAVVTFPTPAVTDIADPTVKVNCVKPSGSGFAVGTTTVVCSAADVYGNQATSVSFTVQVCDSTPPTITGTPTNIPCQEATGPDGRVVVFTPPTALDIVDGAVAVYCILPSGSVFAVGLNTVTCTATDAHQNSAFTTFTIEVCDHTPPTINNTPADIPCVEATSPSGAVVNYVPPTATDIVDVTDPVTCVLASGSTFPIGTSTVICSTVDGHGNHAQTSFTVTVCDRTPPTITGTPSDIPCVEATSPHGAVVTYVPPTANDIVDGAVTVTCVLASGSTFHVGLNTVVCHSADSRGNTAATSFTIQICDTTPPVIHDTPANIPCVEATSAAGAVVTYTLPTATDIVDVTAAVTCAAASGTTFPIGVSTVVCTSTDKHGNTATTSFTIEVCDDTAPTIIGTPANIPCVEATSPAGAVVDYIPPTASDAVDVVAVVCVPPPLSVFPIDITTVICTAADRHGNTAQSSFTVEVCDTTPPVIFDTPNNTLCIEATSPAGAVYSFPLPTAADVFDGPNVPVYCVLSSGSTFPVGLSTVTCTSTDAHGNRAQTQFTVEICDTTPPTIHNTPNNIPCVEATGPTGAAVQYTPPTATDIVDGAVSVVCVPAPGSTFPITTTTVTCTAFDKHGNSAQTSFTVEVCDRTPPVIRNTPNNIPCVEATSSAGAFVTYTPPTATDIVDGPVPVTCSPASGSIFPIATTTVTCTAVDAAGLPSSTSFTVEVCDRTPPVITGTPSNIPCVEATSSAGAVVTYTLPTANDIVAGTVTVSCVLASGSTFAVGTSTVQCTAVDTYGNSASSSFTVDVCDTTPPTLHNTPPNIPCVEAHSPGGSAVTYTPPTATDIVDGAVTVFCVKSSGSTFALGISTVTCTATDAHGNSASTSFTIEVCDRTPPTIGTPANIPCREATSPAGAVVSYSAPAAFDIVDGAVAVTCAPASGSVFAIGVTTVTCSASDRHGNSASSSFTITVCDRTAPVICLHGNDPCTEATSPAGAVVYYVTPGVADAADPNVQVTCVQASGTVFPIGTHTIECHATDASGNAAATVSFTVSVCDKTAPVVLPTIIPGPVVGRCYEATSPAGAVVNYPLPTATDAVGGAIPVACVKPPGSTFAIGHTTVQCTATDSAGNTGSFTFVVEVCDSTAPVLAQPSNIPCVEATSAAGAVITYVTPTASDAADPNVMVTCVRASGETFAIGTSTVVCSATDANANTATAVSFTVDVCDRTPPTITGTPSNIPCVEATGPLGAAVTYAQPTASDVVSGAVSVSCAPASGTTFAIGTTTVTCTASDARGNSASTSFTVKVCDTTVPVISPHANVPCVEATSPLGAVVTYVPPTVADTASPTPLVVSCIKPSGSTFPVGVSTVTCTAADGSGNQAVPVTFTVSVCDTKCPVWNSFPANMVGPTATTSAGSAVTYTAPTATDAAATAVTITCDKPSGTVFPVGLTTVTCSAYDAAGNNCPRSFTVLVCYFGYTANAAKTQCVQDSVSGNYCTYTQGGWGANLPTSCGVGSTNPECLLDRCYAPIFGAKETAPNTIVGDTSRSYPNKPTQSPFWAEWTSAAAIRAYLPGAGTAGQLNRKNTDPTTTSAGVLAAQALALTLNVQFDNTAVAGCRFPRASTLVPLSQLLFNDRSSPLHGQTVAQILAKANAYMSKGANCGSLSASVYTDALDKINRNFDNCSANLGYLKVPVPCGGR